MAKTARFATVVDKCGAPEVYLLWRAPGKDRGLKRLVAEHRVMTVVQPRVGTQKDWGEVGLGKDLSGQVLVFPRSLSQYEGKRIVGVDYALLKKLPEVPLRQQRKGQARVKDKLRNASISEGKGEAKAEVAADSTEDRKTSPVKGKAATKTTLPALRRAAKSALKAWDAGNQLPAYKVLGRLVSQEIT